MNIQQLEYILALYQYGNFARASEKCYVTQPTLSMMVKKLEDELGMIIFDRNKNPIEPTEMGQQIIEYAQKILQEIDTLKQIAKHAHQQKSGTLKIAVIPTISTYLLPLIIPSFIAEYPHIHLNIQELTTDEIITQLKKSLIDIGILATPLEPNYDFLEKKMFIEQFFVYTSEKNLLKQKHISLKHIKHYPVWVLKEGHCLRNQILEICSPLSTSNVQFIAGNLETIIKIIDYHGGTTVIPELMLKYLNNQQMKKVRPFEKPIPSREISIVQNKAFIKEHIINLFYDHIIRIMKNELKTPHKIKILSPRI